MIAAAAHHATPVTNAVGWMILIAIIALVIWAVSKLVGSLLP